MSDLTGKVAVITSASSGVVVQMAEALAEGGADAAVMVRSIDKLASLKEKITAAGHLCL